MQTLQLKLPDFVMLDAQEVSLLLAAKLYEQGKLSLGQAAQLAGFSKRTFVELLGKQGVSVFNYAAEDIAADFHHA